MAFRPVTFAEWRAHVEKDLAGVSFDKALVQRTPEGLAIAPLYSERPAIIGRELPAGLFRICMQHARGASVEAVLADVEGGADALWLSAEDLARHDVGELFLVLDGEPDIASLLARGPRRNRFALARDPIGQGSFDLARMTHDALALDSHEAATGVMVSTLPYHAAGADAADEIGLALSTGAHYIDALLEAGFGSVARAARQIALQVAVGRETFVELCKLRALRTCWRKLLVASGAPDAAPPLIHAVCAPRTLTIRDPWVNMLRVTTEVFAAVLGGADLVTPASFDQAIGLPSDLGRRVARNTGLVLREESFLGKVSDPAGGAYYFETLTDGLSREGWARFRELERSGGVVEGLASGRIQAKLAANWQTRLDAIAKRKIPILGVSDFANLKEVLPKASSTPPTGHRDAEAFEALRTRGEARALEAILVPLGKLEESRARVGFATGFFGAGGIATRESSEATDAKLACICGPDERYAAEAAAVAQRLKAAGVTCVVVAGRPGASEQELRDAGVDGFIFVGCDVVGTLSTLLKELP